VKEVCRVDDPWLRSYFRMRTMLEGAPANHGT